ncbi:TPA: hypothetical protein F7001_02630 [Legionella pneumophila]|uniref:Uncharacterized protein n=1 Tax=Legionella fallonii LLAP-10 TaxID=1212491 RepID=A0A098G8G8_9GAMM|nr:hypothetical protein [Legionella fallonii]CEG58274.1 conserved membrane protein of unknown function [Legionella fallonii LLAP-10]HAU3668137.1 hypothetical protein [Legionella pneumophila]
MLLALVVLLGAIIVLFSEEFIKSFKKLWAIKGAKLLLPLFAASWFVYTFDFWVLWVIFYLHQFLHDTLTFLITIMPFQQGAESVALVILLTFFSIVPVLIIDFFTRKKKYKGYQYPYITSTIIWIFCVALLIII